MSKTGSRSNPRIFAMIAKISMGLRKFRNHSENFAILAKLRIFARLAKFTIPRKIFQFRYLTKLSLGEQNFAS